jgi:hypothetical protein
MWSTASLEMTSKPAHRDSVAPSGLSAPRAQRSDNEKSDSEYQAKDPKRFREAWSLGDSAPVPPRGERGSVRSAGEVECERDASSCRDDANDQVLHPVGHSGDRKRGARAGRRSQIVPSLA